MCKLSHRRTCPYATCDIISYVLFRLPCIHAVCRLRYEFMRVFTHTKRRVSVHFLTYEIMSMLNFTPCLSHNFPQVQSKQSTTSRLWNLRTLLIMQLFYLQDVSMCKLSHRRTCLYATCDIISYVLSRLPCIYAVFRLRGVFVCVFTHTKRRMSAHFLTYENMSMRKFKHDTLFVT